METKSIIFLSFCLCAIPIGIAAVGRSSRLKDACAFLLLLGTTRYDLEAINFFSREWYRGTTRGFEVCWLDFLWVFLLVNELRNGRSDRAPRPFGLTCLWLFFGYNALNILISDPRLFGLFELSKLFRGIMVVLAIARYVKSERELRLLVWALCIAVGYEWTSTVYARVILGHPRPEGTLAHPNSLSMYNLISVPVLLAVSLSDTDQRLRRACAVASVLGAMSVLMTVSRAGLVTLLLLLLGVGLTCGSLKITGRKLGAAFVLLLLGGFLYVKLAPSFQARFESEGGLEKEYGGDVNEGRGAFLHLAAMMVRDDFWGCGLNNWSYQVSNHYGRMIGMYYLPYAGVDEPPPEGKLHAGSHVDAPQAPPGHSLYAITLGETGWPGVFLFGLVWVRWLQMTGSFFFKRSAAFRSRFGVGAFFGLVGAFGQSFSEWEFRQTPLLFLLCILLGMVAALHPARPAVLSGAGGRRRLVRELPLPRT